MSSQFYSRPVFVAHDALASIGIDTKKGHLREVVSALHGFKSLAALQAYSPLRSCACASSTAVILDEALALSRCQSLIPGADPARVVREVVSALASTASPSHFYVDRWIDVPTAATLFARSCALARPEMSGVADDLEGRVLAALKHFAMGGEVVRGGPNEKLLRSVSSNAGPVTLHQSDSLPYENGRRLSFMGQYEDASGKEGIVHVETVYQWATASLYHLHSTSVTFRPGEDYFDQYDQDDSHESEYSFVRD